MAFLGVVVVVVLMMIALLWTIFAGSPGVTLLLMLVAVAMAVGIIVLARRHAPRW